MLKIPDGVGISRDAKIAFGVAAQIFVSYATATYVVIDTTVRILVVA